MRTLNILNLGAGWQSSLLFLKSCRGELPKFDAAVFADTKWEPKAVYKHLKWLKSVGKKAGIPILMGSAGDLRQDAIDFRQLRASSDGKRYASIPFFVKNPDGKQGRIKRQCTKEYKIEVCDRIIRREIIGLKPGQRFPKDIIVRRWYGISQDEPSRAVFPGIYKTKEIKAGKDLFGNLLTKEIREWKPIPWAVNVYALLGMDFHPDRKIKEIDYGTSMDRTAVGQWLKANYPAREIPRSACIGCPFHDNDEWKNMRDNFPEEWADAVQFDADLRIADQEGQVTRGRSVGLPYVHRQLVPLAMADLDGPGEKGGGCGTLLDGLDGLCDT